MTRREFMRRSAVTAAGATGAAAILAACKTQTSTLGDKVTSFKLARPDNPVRFTVDQNQLIADGMKSEAGPLKLYNWQDYISPATIKQAEKALNTQIIVSTFNTLDEAIAKLTSTSTDVDVFFPTQNLVSRLVKVGLLRPLNHSYLANLPNVWDTLGGGTTPQVAAEYPFYDQGSQYTVPYTLYTSGVGYRIDKGPNSNIQIDLAPLEQQIPAMEVPYDIYWDKTYKGFVYLLDDEDTMGMAILRHDLHAGASAAQIASDINTDNPATRSQVLAQCQADLVEWQNTMNGKMDVSDYTDLPEGTCYIHSAWSGDLVSAQYYFPSWSPKNVLRYWRPEPGVNKYGGVIGSDTLAILMNGKNPVLAHKFLNFMLDPNNALGNFTWSGYQPPQKIVLADPTRLLSNSSNPLKPYNVIPPSLSTCIVTEDEFKFDYQMLETSPATTAQWTDAWNTIKNA
jgi:spermidine/putrescine transport system substrate-binding protein